MCIIFLILACSQDVNQYFYKFNFFEKLFKLLEDKIKTLKFGYWYWHR